MKLMAIEEINNQQFDTKVIDAEQPVLVDFWAPWCGPCKMVAPTLETIDNERQDVRIVKVNIDDNPETAARFGIMSIPTMLIFHQGTVAGQIVGAQAKTEINSAIDRALV